MTMTDLGGAVSTKWCVGEVDELRSDANTILTV